MSIADYKPETAEVEFKGGSLTVRGLALDDVAVLMRTHMSDIDGLVAIFQNGVSDDIAIAQMSQYAMGLLREAPGLVSNLIALACDDAENVPLYRQLPMPVMLRAVESIGKLTFEEAGGPKKFIESLLGMLRVFRAPTTASLI